MRLEGELVVDMDLDTLWSYIEKPEEFAKSIPGMEEYTIEGDVIKAKVKAGIGFIKATFKIDVKLNKDPENKKVIMNVKGSGAGNRFEGDIYVDLEPADGKTKITWWSEAKVSGLVATVGSSTIKREIEKIFNGAFEQLSKK